MPNTKKTKATKTEGQKYPEVWFMEDGVGTWLGWISQNPPERHPDKFHIMINAGLPGHPMPYFDELKRMMIVLGEEVMDLPEMLDGKPGGVIIGPVHKEEAITTLTNAGFMARKATPREHQDLMRSRAKL